MSSELLEVWEKVKLERFKGLYGVSSFSLTINFHPVR